MKKFVVTGLALITMAVILIGAPCGPTEPTTLDVTFTADLTAGLLNGNCEDYDEYKWASKGIGKSMFIVGAVHSDYASTEDPDGTISAMLGNWTPNTIKLNKVGDNKYSVTLKAVPVGTHFAYKYTWGNEGDSWTDTEEFPGNSRIVQVVDTNKDGKFSRYDKFADETTNKDTVNLNYCGDGTVDWSTDINTPSAGKDCAGDGKPDAQETFETDKGINYYYCAL